MLFVILLVYVRILEAEADEITQKLGLGKELAEALYHLESFYQGIAGSMGLSVHLLTGKKRPDYQVIIDAGDAARQIVNHATKASRVALLTNLIMSHPPSAFRIVGVLHPEKFSKYKLALLPVLLLLPKMRSRYLRQVAEHWTEIDELLTEKYKKMGHSLEEYVELSLAMHQARPYVGCEIHAVPPAASGLPKVHGIVRKVRIGNTLMNAVVFEVEDAADAQVIHEVSYFVHFIVSVERDHPYFLKNGELAILKDVTFNKEKRRLEFEYALIDPTSQVLEHGMDFENDGTMSRKKMTKYLGFPLSTIISANSDYPVPVILRQGGKKEVARIVRVSLRPRFHDTVFHMTVLSKTGQQTPLEENEETMGGEEVSSPSKVIEKTVKGRDIIITRGLMSFDAMSLKNVFTFLKEQQIPLYLFLVNDPDNYIPCLAERCTDETITVKVGRETLSYPLKEVDGALIEWLNLWQVQMRKELGILGSMSRVIANRGTIPPFLR